MEDPFSLLALIDVINPSKELTESAFKLSKFEGGIESMKIPVFI